MAVAGYSGTAAVELGSADGFAVTTIGVDCGVGVGIGVARGTVSGVAC